MMPATRAESLINELCISSANEIDIEAIAYDAGIEILYERLYGCEATLVGFGSRAIATINPSLSRGRERFSIAHEIGHWIMHRGKSFRCRVDDIVQNYEADVRLEKEADLFASHLLMPTSIFRLSIKAANRPGLRDLQEIANQFEVSLQAVSIRLALLDSLPVIVACYNWTQMVIKIPSYS